MAISALSVSNFGGIASVGLSSEQGLISQPAQAQAQSLPDTSAIVTLGAGTPAPLTYNAAGLIDALGILQNSPSNSAAKALSSLLSANLGLTASVLKTQTANASALDSTGLLRNSLTSSTTDSTAQSFASLLVAEANLATARLNANVTPSSDINGTGVLQTSLVDSTTQALTGLAVADVNLATAAVDTSTTTDTTVGVASALGDVQNLSAESTSEVASEEVASGLPATGLNTPATGLQATATAEAVKNPAVNTQNTPTANASEAVSSPPVISAIPAATELSSTATAAGFFNANVVLQSLVTDAAAQALTTVATDPTYAAAAAALYVSAGVFHSQLNVPQNLLPGVSSPIPLPVLPIKSSTKLAANT